MRKSLFSYAAFALAASLIMLIYPTNSFASQVSNVQATTISNISTDGYVEWQGPIEETKDGVKTQKVKLANGIYAISSFDAKRNIFSITTDTGLKYDLDLNEI